MAKKHQTNGEAETPASAASPTISFQKGAYIFPVTHPYSAGHVLTAEEAQALNQTRSENLRNNFAGTLATATKDGATPDLTELASKFAEYDASYVFSGKRAPRAPADPIGAVAYRLAKTDFMAAFKAKNMNPKDLGNDKIDAAVKRLVETKPAYMEEAKRRHESGKNLALFALDALEGV